MSEKGQTAALLANEARFTAPHAPITISGLATDMNVHPTGNDAEQSGSRQ